MSKLHLVFGGRVKDPQGLDFDLGTIDLVGIYDSYAAAEDAWRGAAQRTVSPSPSVTSARCALKALTCRSSPPVSPTNTSAG